jgi:hypothetical protein
MGGLIIKQPNGKYARFSTVVDDFTHINMTADDYINMCVKQAMEDAKKEAKQILEHHVYEVDELDNAIELLELNYPEEKVRGIREILISAMTDPYGHYTIR